jgi:PD-(D/E)XK nuclease superfamily
MTRLQLYSHAGDAWQSGLGEWLRRRSAAAATGQKTWFVTDSYQQVSWLRQQALQSGLTLFGIHFMNCRHLRQRLCQLAGLPTPVFGRETLRLLTDCALSQSGSEFAQPMGAALLEALDELAASGWLRRHGEKAAFDLLGVPAAQRQVLARLTASDFWRPRTDQRLKRELRRKGDVAIGIFGFDALCRHETDLLLAALNFAHEGRVWFHQPLVGNSPNFEWIEVFETALGLDKEVCPAASDARPFESFVDSWNGVAPENPATPDLLVANTWADQVRHIVDYTASVLVREPGEIAIVVPDNSLTGPAVVRELLARGIAVTDEIREPTQAPDNVELARLAAEFVSERRTIEVFLKILHRCLRDPEQFGLLRDRLLRVFGQHQTRAVEYLIEFTDLPAFVKELLAVFPAAPSQSDWKGSTCFWRETCEKVTSLCAAQPNFLRAINLVDPQSGVPWAEIGMVLDGRSIPSALFFGFVRELLPKAKHAQTESVRGYAKVVVTPASKRLGCVCDHLILADAQAEAWPIRPLENPILRDALKEKLDFSGILTGSQERRLHEERYLQLLYHTRGRAALSWYRFNQGEELLPNHLVTFCELALQPKVYKYHRQPAEPEFPKPSIQRLREIHRTRLDPSQPFDRYFLNFAEANLPRRAWHPSQLKAARETPGTFAFKMMFRCEIERNRVFRRTQADVLGSLMHRLLENAFYPAKDFARLRDILSLPSSNSNQVAATLQARIKAAADSMIASLGSSENDLWWSSILKKAVWLAAQIVRNLTPVLDPAKWVSSEYEMTSNDQPGRLYLRGRADLVISDRKVLSEGANVTVIDFKSSLSEGLNSLIARHILQFVAYADLVRSLGADQSQIELATPVEARSIPEFRLEDGRVMYQDLVRTQETLCFGRRGDARNRFETIEHLPIATLPIDQQLLERKRQLSWAGLEFVAPDP